MTERINEYMPPVVEFFNLLKLDISTSKSTVTLFTPDTRQAHYHPQVVVNGDVLPLERRPKILGVTFDTMFTFSNHCRSASSRVSHRNNILRALAGTSWGQDKETILMTYKAIGRSILDYAAPVWSPVASTSSFKRLQIAQNAALRIATGCVMMASEDHLHQECSSMPVQDHVEMLTAQFLANSLDPGHPCHALTQEGNPPRNMKTTMMKFSEDVELARSDCGPAPSTKNIVKRLHTEFVTRCKNRLRNNEVLGAKPPTINPAEKALPRTSRTTLAQLRSNFSLRLNSYRSRLDPTVQDSCPACGVTPHNTRHLFSCQVHPIDATPADLWIDPLKVASELGLDLPPDPPPPEPPPDPDF